MPVHSGVATFAKVLYEVFSGITLVNEAICLKSTCEHLVYKTKSRAM